MTDSEYINIPDIPEPEPEHEHTNSRCNRRTIMEGLCFLFTFILGFVIMSVLYMNNWPYYPFF